MITEIQKENWKNYFDNLSRSLSGWNTTVEIVSDEIGAQILSSGLPFGGITLTEKDGAAVIELSLGVDSENHQTHNITDPVSAVFDGRGLDQGGILDIEDRAGSKTLIRFVPPFPEMVSYAKTDIVVA